MIFQRLIFLIKISLSIIYIKYFFIVIRIKYITLYLRLNIRILNSTIITLKKVKKFVHKTLFFFKV